MSSVNTLEEVKVAKGYPYKRYDDTPMFPKTRHKHVFVSMAPYSSTNSRKFGRSGTKEARKC